MLPDSTLHLPTFSEWLIVDKLLTLSLLLLLLLLRPLSTQHPEDLATGRWRDREGERETLWETILLRPVAISRYTSKKPPHMMSLSPAVRSPPTAFLINTLPHLLRLTPPPFLRSILSSTRDLLARGETFVCEDVDMVDVLIHVCMCVCVCARARARARAVGMLEPLRNGGALGYMAHKEGGGPLCPLSISLLSLCLSRALSLSISLSLIEREMDLCVPYPSPFSPT